MSPILSSIQKSIDPASSADVAIFADVHLRIHPLSHPGARRFAQAFTDPYSHLVSSIKASLTHLYANEPHLFPTNIRSITLFIRPMGGVAYTTGNWLHGEDKEIHLSADYIARQDIGRLKEEIEGVLVHEMVHVWQYDGKGTAPGGLIDGVADYVRLRAGLSPPHWHESPGSRWDQGYESTAYFLNWIEERHNGFVKGVNAVLKDARWDEGIFELVCGESLQSLWEQYKKLHGEISARGTI